MPIGRSVLEIILSLKGDKAVRELKKVDKNLDKVDKSARKSGQGIKRLSTDMLKMGAAVGGAVAGLGILAKSVFEVGKHGAKVEQTGRSFEFLVDKLGGAPDILERMRRETKGTVDDMTLMSSTMTLLAGTSDRLGKELLDATPQLLKIAKAANKVNPALGDTAFLYESITSGIKRNSKLILDNLGIVFSQQTAYEEYAASIGKTVDQLNDEEQVLATLNAAMKSGNNLIAQAGGNVDALGDDMARAEVAAKNLGDEWSKFISGPVAEASTGIAGALNAVNEHTDAYQALRKAIAAGIITQEEANEVTQVGKGVTRDYALILEFIAEKTEEYNEQFKEANQVTDGWAAGLRDLRLPLQNTTESTDEAKQSAEEYKKELKRLAGQAAATIREMREMEQVRIADFFDVDLNIGDVAARMFDINNFKQAGGDALAAMVEEVKKGLALNKLTPEQANEFFENIAIEAAAIEVELGKIDVSEASEQIAEDFNIPLGEAREKIDSVLEGIDLVNQADITGIIESFDNLQERKEKLIEREELLIDTDPQGEADSTLIELQDKVDYLTARPWVIEFEIVTKGTIPKVSGGKVTVDEGPGGQFGMDFVVPPGFPNDTFPMRVSSGEHVTVTPAGKQRGGDVYSQYVTQHFHSEGAAALGMAITRKFGRDRLNASMGR